MSQYRYRHRYYKKIVLDYKLFCYLLLDILISIDWYGKTDVYC